MYRQEGIRPIRSTFQNHRLDSFQKPIGGAKGKFFQITGNCETVAQELIHQARKYDKLQHY